MKKYTDQKFLYRQTPVNYDGIAKFTSIKGNTLGWNQLVENGNFESTMGWKAANTSYGTISVSGNILTYTVVSQQAGPYNYRVQQQNGDNLGIPVGHKLYIALDFKPSEANEGNVQLQSSVGALDRAALSFAGAEANKWTHLSTIYTIQNASQYIALYLKLNNPQTVGATFQFKNFVIIDLTQMGLDSITSVEEFTSLFPLSYYDFNQGTLIPFSGNGIKTTGKNLLSYNGENLPYNANGVSITREDNIYKVVASNPSGYPFARISTIHYLPKGQYTVTMLGAESSSKGIAWRLIDRNVSPVKIFVNASETNTTFTLNEDLYDVYFEITIDASKLATGTWDVRFQLNMGTPSEYEPYTSTTTDLPISTYFPTGMKRAGNVYDELTESKAITRVGAYTITSFEGKSGATANNMFSTNAIMNLVKKPSADNVLANVKSNHGETVTMLYLWSNNKVGVAINTNGTIYVGFGLNGSVTTLAQANAYVQSNPITVYYELKTPTETDAEDIFYIFYADGMEQLLPVNGATPTTAPIIADIEYYNQTESETPYRKFWLVNGNGERWNLTEKELKSFLDSPQGLGFQKSIDVTRYGESAYKNTESYNFPQVSGDVFFYDTANATRYEKYNEFVRFLMVQPLTLYYQIPVSIYSGIADIYTLDCEVINLTKTESKTNRVLTSNIQINGLGFYQGDTVEINGTSATVTINNDGDFPVGFEIELNGDFENPYITLEQDGELYGEAKFDDDGNNFSSVYVNSKDGEQNVVLKQNDSILPNPLAYQDLSISNGSVYVTFVKLAKGESTLTIGADSYSISNYSIKFTPMYRSV